MKKKRKKSCPNEILANLWICFSIVLQIALTLQIQSGKCCALGEFLIKLWSAIQLYCACTARVVLA